MPAFNQDIHIEQDVSERLELAWDYTPSDGGPPRQDYVVMCIVAPEGTNQKYSSLAVKIFGCFGNKDDADRYAAKLSKECDFFDYYVATTKEWLKLPPQVESIDDVHYQEGALSDIKQRLVDMRSARAKLMQERILADKESRKRKELEQSEAVDSSDSSSGSSGQQDKSSEEKKSSE